MKEIHFVGGDHWDGFSMELPVLPAGYMIVCSNCDKVDFYTFKDQNDDRVYLNEELSAKYQNKINQSKVAAYN